MCLILINPDSLSILNWVQTVCHMRGSRKFCQRGSSDNVFLNSREDPNTTISEPTSIRKRNAIKMAFRWRADDGQALNAGLVAVIFPISPLWIHVCVL